MSFGTSILGAQRILTVNGELDLSVSAPFEEALRAALAALPAGGELVVDLSEVVFFDVSALRALLRAMHDAEALGLPISLIGSHAVDRVFVLFEIDAPGVPQLV